MSRTAQVKRDARIGEAEARRDAGVRVSVKSTRYHCYLWSEMYMVWNICCHNKFLDVDVFVEWAMLVWIDSWQMEKNWWLSHYFCVELSEAPVDIQTYFQMF